MNFFFADFRFLGPFMNGYHDLSDKFFSVCHAPLPPLLDEISLDATEVTLKVRKLKFWLLLCQLDAPYTQNFEI
jgi:hypothetical protein